MDTIALIAIAATLLFAVATLISALVAYHFRVVTRIHRRHAAEVDQLRRDYDAMTERWRELTSRVKEES